MVGGGQTEKSTATINGLEDKECHLFFSCWQNNDLHNLFVLYSVIQIADFLLVHQK